MIYVSRSYFIFLTWVLVGGPSKLPSLPLALVLTGLVAAFAFRRSFQRRTLVLMSVFGIMSVQSILLVLDGLHLDFFDMVRTERHIVSIAGNMFPGMHAFFTLDLGLAEVGVIASVCAAVYIHFGKSRLDMSKTFPGTNFLEPPDELKHTVERYARLAGTVCPEVQLVDAGMPSAFTVRVKGKYVLALTVGLLESLDDLELQACIAHEISHLKNRDFLVRSLATLARIALFAKPLSYLIEPAIYRAREFLADKTAVSLMGDADPLISVLSKLLEAHSPTISTSLGSVCACWLNGKTSSLRVFDKHPDLGSRIAMLQELKRSSYQS